MAMTIEEKYNELLEKIKIINEICEEQADSMEVVYLQNRIKEVLSE